MIGRKLPVSERALVLHRESLVLDCHSHFLLNACLFDRRFDQRAAKPAFYNPFKNTLDLESVLAGGINSLAFTAYIPGRPWVWNADAKADWILDTYERILGECAGKLVHCTTADQIRAVVKDGRLATFLAVEGGHHIRGKLEKLEHFYDRGVRSMTLTHFVSNYIADSNTSPYRPIGGLSDFGREVVREMERLGMMVDLCHCTDKAVFQVLDMATRPPMYSHAALKRHNRFPRNLTDDQVKAVAAAGGMIGLIFFLRYLGRFDFTINAVARQAADIAEMVGSKHLCIGSDMDGYTYTPWGFRDASDMPQFTQALIDYGFSDAEIRGILGENFLDYFSGFCSSK